MHKTERKEKKEDAQLVEVHRAARRSTGLKPDRTRLSHRSSLLQHEHRRPLLLHEVAALGERCVTSLAAVRRASKTKRSGSEARWSRILPERTSLTGCTRGPVSDRKGTK